MTARDGEELDDGIGDEHGPMLTGMRSVWREMRDTDAEPPSRGLAELMAAARVQAAAMKPPEEEVPWWRRAFAVMLRPPVLAAATVIVLIGGAVALKSRGADEAAMPTVTTARDPGESDKQKRAEGPGAGAREQAMPEAVVLPPTAEPPPSDGFAGAGSGAPAKPAVVTAPVPRARPPAPAPKLEKQQDLEVSKKDHDEAAKTPREEPRTGGMVIADDGVQDKKPASVKATRAPTSQPQPDATAPTVDTIQSDRGGARSPQVSTEQLIKQAETAASRNDCAAVKVTVERIRKVDAKVYKARVANQPAIARCLK